MISAVGPGYQVVVVVAVGNALMAAIWSVHVAARAVRLARGAVRDFFRRIRAALTNPLREGAQTGRLVGSREAKLVLTRKFGVPAATIYGLFVAVAATAASVPNSA